MIKGNSDSKDAFLMALGVESFLGMAVRECDTHAATSTPHGKGRKQIASSSGTILGA